VRNIEADPRVRVRVASWPHICLLAGTARVLHDDPGVVGHKISDVNIARRLCVRASCTLNISPVAVRIDRDRG